MTSVKILPVYLPFNVDENDRCIFEPSIKAFGCRERAQTECDKLNKDSVHTWDVMEIPLHIGSSGTVNHTSPPLPPNLRCETLGAHSSVPP